MKTWKMVVSLCLLAVIITGCVILGHNVSAATEEDKSETPETEQLTSAGESETTVTGSVSVPKTYSTGLSFRSNGDGTCAVSGVGSCTSVCILIPPQSPAGDTVTEILPYAFADSVVGAVELPTTVRTLSPESFARCPRLAFVRVAAGSGAFAESDGVLYSADLSTLIYCPAGRSASALTLSPTLRRVAAGAFRDCTALREVVFSGTTAEWHNVIVGDDNEPLFAAAMRFSGS